MRLTLFVVLIGTALLSSISAETWTLDSSGRLMVPTRVNGLGPFKLLLDTGSQISVLDSDLGIPHPKENESVEGYLLRDGRKVKITAYRQKFKIGSELTDTLPFTLYDLKDLKDLGIDGVLSGSILNNAVISVNWTNKTFTISNDTNFDELKFKSQHHLPVFIEKASGIKAALVWCLVELPLFGYQKFLIDTGADTVELPSSLAQGLAIAGEFNTVSTTPTRVFREQSDIGILKNLKLGSLQKNVHASYQTKSSTTKNGTIGFEILKNFNWSLSLRSGLYLNSRNKFVASPLRKDLLGIRFNKSNVVAAVIDGSPAHLSSIKPGDVIKLIDNQKVVTSKDALNLIHKKRESESIALHIENAGNIRDVTVVLSDYYKPLANDERIDILGRQARGEECVVLGRLYEKGVGVEQNEKKAGDWYKRGIESGDARTFYLLAEIAVVDKRDEDALRFYAASQKYKSSPVTIFRMGQLLGNPNSPVFNPSKAKRAYRLAARAGFVGINKGLQLKESLSPQ